MGGGILVAFPLDIVFNPPPGGLPCSKDPLNLLENWHIFAHHVAQYGVEQGMLILCHNFLHGGAFFATGIPRTPR